MKMYNNGQRPTKMYGGGMASPRKPMQYGGLAQQNRTMTTGMASKDNPMGMMTEKKRSDMSMNLGGAIKKFDMGYNLGGAIKKFEGRQKKALGGKSAKPDFLDLDGDGDKTESMRQAAKQKKSGKKTT